MLHAALSDIHSMLRGLSCCASPAAATTTPCSVTCRNASKQIICWSDQRNTCCSFDAARHVLQAKAALATTTWLRQPQCFTFPCVSACLNMFLWLQRCIILINTLLSDHRNTCHCSFDAEGPVLPAIAALVPVVQLLQGGHHLHSNRHKPRTMQLASYCWCRRSGVQSHRAHPSHQFCGTTAALSFLVVVVLSTRCKLLSFSLLRRRPAQLPHHIFLSLLF
jgi:hypothetical protein